MTGHQDHAATGKTLQGELTYAINIYHLCKAMGIDYLGLISSGTMIIAAENGEKLAERLQEEGIAAAVIGKLTESGRYMLVNDMRLPLAQPKSDALYEAKL